MPGVEPGGGCAALIDSDGSVAAVSGVSVADSPLAPEILPMLGLALPSDRNALVKEKFVGTEANVAAIAVLRVDLHDDAVAIDRSL